jgi:GNAT superfamily N-acetyltransferase
MPIFMNNPSSIAENSAEYLGSFWMRTAVARDVECLAEYFGNLSQTSRYNRFMGAVNNFSKIALDCLIHRSKADRFTLLAELKERSGDTVIGEASCAFDRENGCGEFAISVSDRWQRHGLGSALLGALQFRAVSLGYFQLFGDTLTTNGRMKSLARRAGFGFTRSPDWRAVRFEKNCRAILQSHEQIPNARPT